MKRRWVRRLLKGSLLSLLAVLLLLGATALVGTRTAWGRERVRRWVVRTLQGRFCGPVRVDSLRVQGFWRVEATGVSLSTCDGQPALEAARLDLALALWPVGPGHRIQIRSVAVQGGQVRMAVDAHGQLNLQSLFPVGTKQGTPSDWTVVIEKITATSAVQMKSARWPEVRLQATVAGQLTVAPYGLLWSDGMVVLDVQAPGHAQLRLRGNGSVEGINVRSPGLHLDATVDASVLRAWVPALMLTGPVQVTGVLQGSLFRATAQVDVSSPAGRFRMDGGVGFHGFSWGWHVRATLQEGKPHLAWATFPPGTLTVAAEAHGSWSTADVELQEGMWQGTGASLQVRGEAHARDRRWQNAEAHMQASVEDAQALHPLVGAKTRGQGTLQLDARYQAPAWSLQGRLQGKQIRTAEVAIHRLDVRMDADVLRRRIEAVAHGMRVGEFGFDVLRATTKEIPQGVRIDMKGQGLHGVAVELAAQLHLEPHVFPWEQFSLEVNRLSLNRLGQRWMLTAPAALQWRGEAGGSLLLKPLVLSLGTQRISLAGMYTLPGDRINLQVGFERLDLQTTARFFYKNAVLPKTNFRFFTHLQGSLLHPRGTLSLQGTSKYFDALHWQPARYSLQAALQDGHVRGTASVSTQTNARTSLQGRFDIPFSTMQPLRFDMTGKIPLALLRPVLPTEWQGVVGSVVVALQWGGTLRKPQVHLSIRPNPQDPQAIGTSTWVLQPFEEQSPELVVQYNGTVLQIEGAGAVQDLERQPLGAVHFANVQIPLSWMHMVWETQDPSWLRMPWTGRIRLQQVRWRSLMRVMQQKDPLLEDGVVDATLSLGGTWQNPSMSLDARAQKLQWRGFTGWSAEARLTGTYTQDQVQVAVTGGLQGHPLLEAKAQTTWVLADLWARSLRTSSWQEHAMHVQGSLQKTFPWETLLPVQGRWGGNFDLTGTWAHPAWQVHLQGENVAWEGGPVGDVSVSVSPQSDAVVKADLLVTQPAGGRLSAQALVSWPFVWEKTLLDIQAKQFIAKYEPVAFDPTNPVRTFQGTLDGNIHLHWQHHRPQPTGTFRLTRGELGVTASRRYYRDVELSLDVQQAPVPTQVNVRIQRFAASVEGGTIDVSGFTRMEGWKPITLNWLVGLTHVPVSQGTVGLWLDAQTRVEASTKDQKLQLDAYVLTGGIKLPSLRSAKDLQSIETPKHLHFTDTQEPPRVETPLRDNHLFRLLALHTLPERSVLTLHLPPALNFEGPKLHADLTGKVSVEIAPEHPLRVRGALTSNRGSMQLFSKSYDIAQAEVTFRGEGTDIKPQMSVQLTRPVPQAQFIIDVVGTPDAPVVTLRADPPLYTQPQLLAFLSGADSVDESPRPDQQGRDALTLLGTLFVQQAREVLGQGIGSATNRTLELILPDTLKIDANLGNGNVLQQSGIEVGKRLILPDIPYLSDLLYVSYALQPDLSSAGYKKQNTQQVSIQLRFLRNVKFALRWQFWRNLQLDGVYGDANIFSGGLSLRWRFGATTPKGKTGSN